MRVCWWKLSVHIILCCYLIFIQFPPSCLVDTCRYRCRHHRHNHHCHRISTWSVFSIKNLSQPKAKWIFNKMKKKKTTTTTTFVHGPNLLVAFALEPYNQIYAKNQTKPNEWIGITTFYRITFQPKIKFHASKSTPKT